MVIPPSVGLPEPRLLANRVHHVKRFLVGTIAEYHPELVADEVHRIWRLFLNLLDSNKNTDTVVSSVLEGIRGLFKHFGQDLPVIEFRDLYSKISCEYIEKKGCEKECLQILELYSDLFKELLAKDLSIRERLWSRQESAALKSVYSALAPTVDKQKLQNITDTELQPRFLSDSTEVKFTALSITRVLSIQYGVTAKTEGYVDVPVLQQELNIGNVTVDTASAVLWCIESNALHSDSLLQTAILFYTNIPNSKRKSIVVYGLLNAPEDVRKAAVTLLISESCQLTDSSHNIDKYMPLWSDLFDSKGGKDTMVLERRSLVFGDVMAYLFAVLESILDEGCETLPDKLSPLLTLTFHILTIYPQEEDTRVHCKKLLRLLSDCMHAVTAPLLSAVVVSSQHAGIKLTEYCAKIRVDKCSNEALLCECCFMLIQDDAGVDVDNVLEALQILFSRGNVDPKILIQALQRLENVITEHDDLDTEKLNHIIHLVSKMRTLKDKSDKYARLLHKDIIVFLGKYGNDIYSEICKENSVIARLKDKLFLNIPNTEDGKIYKVNLQRILQLAIVHEDPEALQKLLAIICASLHNKDDPDLQLVLTNIIQASCRAHAHSSIQGVESIHAAVLLCRTVPCVCALLTAIGSEQSPGARKMLSDALEGSLLLESGSELTELLVRTAADEAIAMMGSGNATTRSGGLNVTEALLAALKDNHILQQTILPDLLTLILETSDFDAKDTFQNATKILLDNIQIYDKNTIKETIVKLAKNVVKTDNFNNSIDVKLFKVKVEETSCLMVDVENFDDEVVEVCLSGLSENFGKVVYFMGEYKMGLGAGVFGEVLERIVVLSMDGKGLEGDFTAEAALKFLQEYCDVLYDTNREMTSKAFGHIVSNLHPNNVISLRKQINNFAIVHKKHLKHSSIQETYKNWCSKYQINSAILIEDFSDDIENLNANTVRAMRIYVELFNIALYDDTMLHTICYNILDFYAVKEEKQLDTCKEYFTDLLFVSLKSLTVDNIKKFFRVAYEKADVRFLSYFMSVLMKYFLTKPYILLNGDMKHMAMILKYILQETLKRKHDDTFYNGVLELIDEVWPIFDPILTFEDKHYVLTLANRLPIRMKAESNGMQWAIRECIARENIEDKIRLVELLPGGDECSLSYRSLASLLPTRMSELTGSQHTALRVILDSLANTADGTLLNIIANLADRDPSKGWWDDAMASSVASLARGDCLKHRQGTIAKEEDDTVLMSIANTLFEIPSSGVYHRLLIPLLRYSAASFCEQFYCNALNKLLTTLNTWPRGPTPGCEELMRTLKGHARAMALITLAFERIPLNSLKSPESVLYSQVAKKQASYLIKRVCTLCHTLRTKTIPDDASEDLKDCYRQCLVQNYKCFCAAVCVSRPAEKFYSFLFELKEWEKMVDSNVVYKLPLQSQWNKGRKLHLVAANVPSEGDYLKGLTGTRTSGTLHTRLFLRTLSDDPLKYDLHQIGDQDANAQDLELLANELNKVELVLPLTALVSHAARLTHYMWRESLSQALKQGTRNTRWILAQVICNCKEELSPHASVIRPALLELVADTACDNGGKKTLNGLHFDVLETVLHYEMSPLPELSYSHLSSTIEYLINTAIDNGHRTSIFGTLLPMLGKLAELYTERELRWNGFDECFSAPTKLKYLLSVLLVITKHRVNVTNLLQTLCNLDQKYWSQEPRLSELFGYALSCASERAVYLSQHRRFLARRVGDVDYVKLVYNAQKGYPKLVDEAIFKVITDLTPKSVGTNKTWCLKILSSYVEHTTDATATISDMFETIDICSLLQESNIEALCVLKHGCSKMGGRLRRRVGNTLVGLCSSTDVKVRRPALEVALKIFQGFDTCNLDGVADNVSSSEQLTSKLL
ncbi:hypothetical protein evm_004599 [Chilo suppressalis]|nr:hypothetical protein evm_004599 [Chilo suppressalis]